jgi:hypothetical protein
MLFCHKSFISGYTQSVALPKALNHLKVNCRYGDSFPINSSIAKNKDIILDNHNIPKPCAWQPNALLFKPYSSPLAFIFYFRFRVSYFCLDWPWINVFLPLPPE